MKKHSSVTLLAVLVGASFCHPSYGKVGPEQDETCLTQSLTGGDERLYHDPISDSAVYSKKELAAEGTHYTRTIVNAPEAWKITEGSSDIIVAVVDSGVEISHPDLKSNIWTNEKELNGKPGVDDDGNGFIDDIHGWDFVLNRPVGVDGTGHGTHCAGNVGAVKNGFGVIGVSPRVKIMPVRFLNAKGSGSTDNAIRALNYAASNGARVISNSWGGGNSENVCLKQAIEKIVSKGIYFVAASNNQSRDIDSRPSYPASYPGVIAVGNSDERDSKNPGSNYGKKSVFLFAPGTNSLSTWLGGDYKEITGTSMATPQVAGAIALALSLKPNLTMDQMKKELCESSSSVLRQDSKCGRLDLGEFIKRVSRL